MTISTTLFAFADCIRILDDALEAKHGLRVRVTDENAAIHFRMRLHQARSLTREENKRIYEKEHPQWGRSSYDGLVVRINTEIEDEVWVHLEKHATRILAIEQLEDNEHMLIDHTPAPQIEHKPLKEIVQEPQRLLESPAVFRRRVV